MDIKAFKMDGLGNDFVIIDNRQEVTELSKEQIIKICDRNFIGCDQLILIEKDNTADAHLKFFNSDGGESGACGNGTRCVADLISKEKGNKTIILKTLSGNLKSEILGNNLVTTEIGNAKINWNEIPLSDELNTKNLNIKINDIKNIEHSGGTAINVGTPIPLLNSSLTSVPGHFGATIITVMSSLILIPSSTILKPCEYERIEFCFIKGITVLTTSV